MKLFIIATCISLAFCQTTTKPTDATPGDSLSDVLAREDALKKELAQTRTALANRAVESAPAAAVLVPNRPSNDDLQARLFFNAPPGSAQDQSNQLTAKLLQGGLLGLLSPKIMDQEEAANKLIPALNSNPAVARLQQAQAQNLQGQRQPVVQNPQQAFPYQSQLPYGGSQAFIPQTGFQQPLGSSLTSPLAFGQNSYGAAVLPAMTGVAPTNLMGGGGFLG